MNPVLTELATIRDRLFDLSDSQFAQLVDYVERARSLVSARSFSNDALSAMRPRLRVSRPPRRLNALRVFCRPFEDLLYVWPNGRDDRGLMPLVNDNQPQGSEGSALLSAQVPPVCPGLSMRPDSGDANAGQ